jgi:putative copper resistance protein D
MSWLAAVRGVHLAASALIAGAIAFEFLVLRRAAGMARTPDQAAVVRGWLNVLVALGIGVGLVSWVAWLSDVAIGMTGLPATEALTMANLRTVVTRTTFGRVWAFRSVLLVLFALALLRRTRSTRSGRGSDVLLGAAATALTGSLAWTGHAVASHPAHLWVDAAHLCAAAVWLGMLPALWLLLRRAGTSGDAGWARLSGRCTRLFSPPAMAAVLVLILTGTLNAWWLVGTPAKLLGNPYGLLLSAKLALFALMLGLAAVNRMVLTPRIDSADAADAADAADGTMLRATRQLQRNVVLEILLAAAILALVGQLGVTPPAAHQHPAHDEQEHHHEHHD